MVTHCKIALMQINGTAISFMTTQTVRFPVSLRADIERIPARICQKGRIKMPHVSFSTPMNS